MSAYTIDFSSIITLNTEQFEQLCQANPDVKFERTPTGELVIMSPTGGETGNRNIELAGDFVLWNRQAKLGVLFDSSTCFRLPRGGERSPDISWIQRSRWDALTPEQQRRFPPICPDFVLELLSPSDTVKRTQAKMQEYLDSGAKLGWLLNPEEKQAEIYRLGQSVEVLHAPESLLGEAVLPGFTLNLNWLWD